MSYHYSDCRHGQPALPRGKFSVYREKPRPGYLPRPHGSLHPHGIATSLSPSFTVLLQRSASSKGNSTCKVVEDLISCCPSAPVDFVYGDGRIAAKLFFQQWCNVLEALVFFWSRRLDGDHLLTPSLISRISVSSDREELEESLRNLFSGHINRLLEGKYVSKVESRIKEVYKETKKIEKLLTRPQNWQYTMKLQDQKKRLETELGLLTDKLEEFRAAMGCLLHQLDGKKHLEPLRECSVAIFYLGDSLDWAGIHHIIMRECQRLENGLPIYTRRRDILNSVSANQVVVLIGETGSGKSTQLVQFLADCGLATKGSIICTQPRKIAATSLARRVCEETVGCYSESFVRSHSAYSCFERICPGITYMTDHCLLQRYMNDTSLSGISHIIVDEAHERSLNTDLLLALIKKKLFQRPDLRLVIMSATANASKLADYFYGCCTFHVAGRAYPVDIKYVTDVSDEDPWCKIPKQIPSNYASYLYDVVKMVSIIHKRECAGGILAFLTSQNEVEWACENFSDPSAVVLPLHGKLSLEDQSRVFNNYPGKRKIIFSTNVAETSLTISGIKFVVDSGMAKDCRFDASTGISLLKVTRTSQSSANQRSGRAGRTEPGKCYRLYSESDFQLMTVHQEPEICKVHLGVAVLRILALGMKNVQDFEFVDAPSKEAINKAIQNLVQLGAVVQKSHYLELTQTGRTLVKLGIEPRLGKLILESFSCGLRKEGVVLAAVMANYSSIFCRVGSDEEKHKADCLKVPFCHPEGDLLTLLYVYKEWENERTGRNQWCWQNSINAKSMRRCQETVLELENCLKYELNMITPNYWLWDPHKPSTYDKHLKKVILSSLVENVAMYTGSERFGYEVASTGQKLQLHPSCSLLVYGQKPTWVVFAEILSITNQYLVCVTAVDYDSLSEIELPFNLAQLEQGKMFMKVISGLGNSLLRRLCGKSNHNIESMTSRIQKECMDEEIYIDSDFVRREIHLLAAAKHMDKVCSMVNDVLDSERRLLKGECMEKCLFAAISGSSPSVALFGSGAEIKHLELGKQYLTIEIFHPSLEELNDQELILMIEKNISGIANFSKHAGNGQVGAGTDKWGKVTFLSPEAARQAVCKLNGFQFGGHFLKVVPSPVGNHRNLPFFAIRAKICWPRRPSKGVALVECSAEDSEIIVKDCFSMSIGGRYVNCAASTKYENCLFVTGIPKDVSEPEIYGEFVNATQRKILSVKLFRGDPVDSVPTSTCVEALILEIAPFMPNPQHPLRSFRVEVFEPEPKDVMVKATISFEGSLHLQAAKALENIHGKALACFFPWQKIECRDMFHSYISCPARIFSVIRKRVESLLESFKLQKGVTYTIKSFSGSFRVKLSAPATKIIVDMRRPLELLMRGKTLTHPSLTPLLQLLLSRDGIALLKSLERDTGCYYFYDRHNLHIKLFGSLDEEGSLEEKLIQSLQSLYENKPHKIRLRGHSLPPNLMKSVIQRFGAELHGLKSLVPGVDLSLNTRWQVLHVRGSKEQKQKVEEVISGLALSLSNDLGTIPASESTCLICLCELDEPFCLESCGHKFCRGCLVDQCEAAIRSRDGFPLRCAKEGCQDPFLLTDLKALLLGERLEELFQASVAWFVASSGGDYRFCPTPDCPGVYRVATSEEEAMAAGPFLCGACSMGTCTWCHLEYHGFISCERYKEYKDSPDFSLLDWRVGKENVKDCPVCKHVIEKVDGCDHISCRCGRHICWVCLEVFSTSDSCYTHLRSLHGV